MKKPLIKIITIFILTIFTITPIYAWDDYGDWGDWGDDSNWLDDVYCYADYDWGSDDDWGNNDIDTDLYDYDYWDNQDDDYSDSKSNNNVDNNYTKNNDIKLEFPLSKETAPKEGCAVWCVKQILQDLGFVYTSDQIILKIATILNTTPEILNILLDIYGLSDSNIEKIYNSFFDYSYTTHQKDLHHAIDDNKYVIGIINMGNNKGHDVVILDYSYNNNGSYTYTYYDPKTNDIQTNNSKNFYSDGYIINGKKQIL